MGFSAPSPKHLSTIKKDACKSKRQVIPAAGRSNYRALPVVWGWSMATYPRLAAGTPRHGLHLKCLLEHLGHSRLMPGFRGKRKGSGLLTISHGFIVASCGIDKLSLNRFVFDLRLI